MTLTDAHCHLQDPQFAEDLPQQIERAGLFGIHRFVVNGTCPEDWPKVADLASTYPQVIPQFGVHPWRVEHLPGNWEETLKAMLLRFPNAGVGEIGLDCKLTEAPLPLQVELLRRQLETACRLNRPCTFHIIKAREAFRSVLKERTPPKFLMHSFRGSAEQVKAFAELHAYFSFGGALIRHPNSKKMAAALRAVPPNRLLLETDAPFQHPQGLKTRQEPTGLLAVAEKVAEIRNEKVPGLLRQCEENAERMFGI